MTTTPQDPEWHPSADLSPQSMPYLEFVKMKHELARHWRAREAF